MIVPLEEGENVLPCPLCRGEAHLRSDESKQHLNVRIGGIGFWVKCEGDDCGISPAFARDRTTALARWNRRA